MNPFELFSSTASSSERTWGVTAQHERVRVQQGALYVPCRATGSPFSFELCESVYRKRAFGVFNYYFNIIYTWKKVIFFETKCI